MYLQYSTKSESEVDTGWPLDFLQHGRRLPPGQVVEVVEVGQVGGWVRASWVVVITDVTRLAHRSTDARLSAVELSLAARAARVGRVDGDAERGVDERRVAALSAPSVVIARPQTRATSAATGRTA